tara:strand:+ start:43 stop:798 length:756 start_codon:yes stop_codon:yes gene_type:complete
MTTQLRQFLQMDTQANRIGEDAIKMASTKMNMGTHIVIKNKNKFNKLVKKLNKLFNKTPKEPKLLEIINYGPATNCHQNAKRAELWLGEDYTRVYGYNLCFSNCGMNIAAEVHSVVKNIKTGEYFDYTTDFCGETHKWFLECDGLKNKYEFTHLIFSNKRVLDMLTNVKGIFKSFDGSKWDNRNYTYLGDIEQIVEESGFYDWVKPNEYVYKVGLTMGQVKFLCENKKMTEKIYDKITLTEDDGRGYAESF